MWSTPHITQSINLQHSLPDHDPKLTHMKAVKRKGQQQVTPIPFLNPDPIACLIVHSNKAPVIIDGQEVTVLIDSGAQVSTISAQFCKELTLQIQSLGQLLEVEGMGGVAIPYLRFVEVNLQILGLKSYQDVLLLVIPTMTYSQDSSGPGGYKYNWQSPESHDYGELAKATMTWRQAHFGAVMFGSLQLSCSSSGKGEATTGQEAPFNKVALWRCRSSDSVTSKVQFAPHRKSPYPHLAPSIYGQTPVSRDTVCEYTFSLNQHLVPSCQQQWYPQLPMGKYTLVPQGYQSVCAI